MYILFKSNNFFNSIIPIDCIEIFTGCNNMTFWMIVSSINFCRNVWYAPVELLSSKCKQFVCHYFTLQLLIKKLLKISVKTYSRDILKGSHSMYFQIFAAN